MRIKPFRAWRPRAGWESEIAALPYDVLSRDEAVRLADGRPDSMLYVTRPEIAFPNATPSGVDLAQAARTQYRRLVSSDRLVIEHDARYYLYEQQMGAHCQRGVVALFHVDDYRQGIVRQHEATRRDKERERTALLQAVGAQPGLVFLACRDTAPLDAWLNDRTDPDWLYDFEAADGARHRVAPVSDSPSAAAALASVPVAYIADGHHRAAAAAAVAATAASAASPETWFPAALFPANSLNVSAYHRCVRTLGSMNPESFLSQVRKRFMLNPADPSAQPTEGVIRLLMKTGCWDLRLTEPLCSTTPADGLDVAVLQDHLLRPVLGIEDPRVSPILEFVGGGHARQDIMQRLQSGRSVAAFMVAPVSVETMMQIADEGGSMPPKSTWFEPKLLEGLLVHDRQNA